MKNLKNHHVEQKNSLQGSACSLWAFINIIMLVLAFEENNVTSQKLLHFFPDFTAL